MTARRLPHDQHLCPIRRVGAHWGAAVLRERPAEAKRDVGVWEGQKEDGRFVTKRRLLHKLGQGKFSVRGKNRDKRKFVC